MEKYEFRTDNLYYSNIEDKILTYYGLGYANSSNFMELENGIHSGYFIFATKGTIEFSTIVGKTKDDDYLVVINPSKIKRD